MCYSNSNTCTEIFSNKHGCSYWSFIQLPQHRILATTAPQLPWCDSSATVTHCRNVGSDSRYTATQLPSVQHSRGPDTRWLTKPVRPATSSPPPLFLRVRKGKPQLLVLPTNHFSVVGPQSFWPYSTARVQKVCLDMFITSGCQRCTVMVQLLMHH